MSRLLSFVATASWFLPVFFLTNRVLAFPQPRSLRPQSSSIPSSSVDVSSTPLSQLVHLDRDNGANYHLQSPASDILQLKEGQRLVCVGDVHGDAKALQEFLTIAGVYQADPQSGQPQWIGGNTILVQCGDVLDRGTQELACWNLLTQLSQQAHVQGGHVIVLWGNHEALNAAAQFHYTMGKDDEYERYLAPRIDQSLQTDQWRRQYGNCQPARFASYEPGNGVLSSPLLANMKVAVQVGKTVCVHAGLTAKDLDQYGGLRGMNQAARDWVGQVQSGTLNNLGHFESEEALATSLRQRRASLEYRLPPFLGGGLTGESSPVWMRTYSFPKDVPPQHPDAQRMIDSALFSLGADRMVVGHTVQSKINSALNAKCWRIDVGASRGVAQGEPEVLQVQMTHGREVVSILTGYEKVPAEERNCEQPKQLLSAVAENAVQTLVSLVR